MVAETFGCKLFNTFHVLPEGENPVNNQLNEEVDDD